MPSKKSRWSSKAFRDAYNARRRKRYAIDAAYRQKQLTLARGWRANPTHAVALERYRVKETKRRKKQWHNDPEYRRAHFYFQLSYRVKAFEMIGGAECVRCHVKDPRILEINHINGGGYQHFVKSKTKSLARELLRGDADLSKYNVMCRPCNALDYIERRFPDIKGLASIRWKKHPNGNKPPANLL